MVVRLSTEIWVAAFIRKVETQGASAYLRRRGADMAGAVALKITRLGPGPHEPASTALTRVAAMDGGVAWTWLIGPEPKIEREVDAKLERQAGYDPDLWIVEIEDREARHFLDDPIL